MNDKTFLPSKVVRFRAIPFGLMPAILSLTLFPSLASPAEPVWIDPGVARPPIAKKVPSEQVIHGDRRIDDYNWLRGKSDPEVIAYLKAENEYTASVMGPTKTLQDDLFREILSRTRQTDVSAPSWKQGYWYYVRFEEGKQYPIQCRKQGSLDAEEQVYLDLNELAEGRPYLSVHEQAISDDGRLLAYTTDTTGAREFTLHIKDLNTGTHLPDRVGKVRSLTWAADNATLFYVAEDAAKRPYQLYRHATRAGAGPDLLVFEEKDDHYRLYVRRSGDGQYVLADSQSLTTTETRAVPSERPSEAPRLLIPRQEGRQIEVEHRDGRFYVRTNDHALDYRVISFADTDPRSETWRDVVPHRERVSLEEFDLFSRHAVLHQREEGLPSIRIIDLDTGAEHLVALPERVCAISNDANPDFDTSTYRFRYSSPLIPESVFEYDMADRRLTLLKRGEVPCGLEPDRYAVERTHATAPDGARVPVTLVYRKDVPLDGTAPALLYSYGAYGAPMEASFDPARFSLLDRGVVFAMAHVRGGGDLGAGWREQGKTLSKLNSITDFIAVAEDLIARKFTSPDRLAVQSLSAGGVMIGGALNLRPELFKVAVLLGPFLDVVNTSLDPAIPLTIPEYLEWGNPNVLKEYEYLKTYCPYTNLRAQSYPAMLLLTSIDDSQVMYWEAVKYAAKLRTLKTDANPLLLRVSSGAGHKGSSGRYDALREKAFTYAFLLDEIAPAARWTGFSHRFWTTPIRSP